VVEAKKVAKWLCAVCAKEITGDSVMCDCCLCVDKFALCLVKLLHTHVVCGMYV